MIAVLALPNSSIATQLNSSDPDFIPYFEALVEQGRCFEMRFILYDDGFVITFFIPKHGNDANLREDFEERASIKEFDGNLPRDHAECQTLLDVLNRHPCAILGGL